MDYLTVRDVAERLGVTTTRVYQMARYENRLPYVMRGRRMYFPKVAWDAYQAAEVREALAKVGMAAGVGPTPRTKKQPKAQKKQEG